MTYTPAEVVLRDNSGGDGIGGKATLWRTENALKVLFCVDDNDIISYGKEYNEPLWKGDTAEMFLTLGRRNRYLELEVNPDGAGYATFVENRNGEFELEFVTEPPFKWEARRTEYGYECSFEIPFSTLKAIGFDDAGLHGRRAEVVRDGSDHVRQFPQTRILRQVRAERKIKAEKRYKAIKGE